MTRRADHAYAAARIAARFGDLVAEDVWQRLSITRQFGPWLEEARRTPLKRWLARLADGSPPHAAERTLREEWRAAVAETASWLQCDERPAVLWLAVWPWLAPVQALAPDHPRPELTRWAAEDGDLAPLAEAERSGTFPDARDAPLAAIATDDSFAAWRAEWRRRLARGFGDGAAAVEHLLAALAVADPATRQRDAATLGRAYRRHAGGAVDVFFYLALLWLEFVRLRGAVATRLAFANAAGRVEP